jgi:hypothetical protein
MPALCAGDRTGILKDSDGSGQRQPGLPSVARLALDNRVRNNDTPAAGRAVAPVRNCRR